MRYSRKKFEYEDVSVSSQLTDDGFLIFGEDGTEFGHITIEDAENMKVVTEGNVLTIQNSHGGSELLYWVQP